MWLRRVVVLAAGLVAFFAAGFVVAEAFGVPWLAAPPPLEAQPRPVAGVIGVGVLVTDALLPVPSSLVMIALGGLFGSVGGAALALAGRTGAAVLGYVIGRLLPASARPDARSRAARLLDRWGVFAVVLTRPVPVAGESVAVLAGALGLGWRRLLPAAVVGSAPEAVLYAWVGSASRGGVAAVVWCVLLALAGLTWAGVRLAGGRARAAGEQ